MPQKQPTTKDRTRGEREGLASENFPVPKVYLEWAGFPPGSL